MSDHPDDYDAVTARDIAEFLHHLADLRCAPNGPDPAQRAEFLACKAALLSRIADQAERTRSDTYSQQVRQIANTAHATATAAADQQRLPKQRVVGPKPKRTTSPSPNTSGAKTEKNSGASSG
ncbi:MAG: hypothetical protein ACRDT8_11630 [Micromonosporaceae bacterium]